MKTLYAMFTAALGLSDPERDETSRLVPRDPPIQYPLDNETAEISSNYQVFTADLGKPVDDIIAGATVYDSHA